MVDFCAILNTTTFSFFSMSPLPHPFGTLDDFTALCHSPEPLLDWTEREHHEKADHLTRFCKAGSLERFQVLLSTPGPLQSLFWQHFQWPHWNVLLQTKNSALLKLVIAHPNFSILDLLQHSTPRLTRTQNQKPSASKAQAQAWQVFWDSALSTRSYRVLRTLFETLRDHPHTPIDPDTLRAGYWGALFESCYMPNLKFLAQMPFLRRPELNVFFPIPWNHSFLVLRSPDPLPQGMVSFQSWIEAVVASPLTRFHTSSSLASTHALYEALETLSFNVKNILTSPFLNNPAFLLYALHKYPEHLTPQQLPDLNQLKAGDSGRPPSKKVDTASQLFHLSRFSQVDPTLIMSILTHPWIQNHAEHWRNALINKVSQENPDPKAFLDWMFGNSPQSHRGRSLKNIRSFLTLLTPHLSQTSPDALLAALYQHFGASESVLKFAHQQGWMDLTHYKKTPPKYWGDLIEHYQKKALWPKHLTQQLPDASLSNPIKPRL